ncbi:MAG: hypothetical protein KJ077_05260 [Anaerolineae bacterium]|nr:hypothetical protein [Anaerolineae bacterium]
MIAARKAAIRKGQVSTLPFFFCLDLLIALSNLAMVAINNAEQYILRLRHIAPTGKTYALLSAALLSERLEQWPAWNPISEYFDKV